jgi:tripartite-type tricarboxylate transporter receptor subunit TctC
MRFARQKFIKHVIAVAITVFVLSGHGAWSQATRTIKIVVPVSPGGVLDTLARLLGEQIRHAQGQTVLVENRSGAGGMIAAEAVSRAAPELHPDDGFAGLPHHFASSKAGLRFAL